MRLLLDEHYARTIAEQLRARGHDVVSVTERADLIGLDDAELFALMRSERRAILTENYADFERELRHAGERGEAHYGVVFTSRTRLPRSRNTIGVYVEALDAFLGRHPAEDALVRSARWLPAPPG